MRILLTGATSGIGLAAAHLFARTADLLVVQGPTAVADLPTRLTQEDRGHGSCTIRYIAADFDDPDALARLADQTVAEAGGLDLLVNNAGIPGATQFTLGAWKMERTFAINYLAGALLSDLLLPHLCPSGRIVNVASATHESAQLDLDDVNFEHRRYSPITAYAQSKLAVVTNTARLAERIPQTVISLHPGVISTGLLHAMFGVGGASPRDGGENLVAATTMEVPSGSYLFEREVGMPNPVAKRPEFQRGLHELTTRVLDREVV
jgi:NAD(P)-dependent dehydrogenase (short-subunit alcohol dehydrogenase family)